MAELAQDPAHPDGRDLIAVVEVRRYRGDDVDLHERLERAGAKTGPYIAPVRRVKISPRIANQQRRSRPAATAQDFVSTKPGFGVFPVRINDKPWIRLKGIGRPFPDVA